MHRVLVSRRVGRMKGSQNSPESSFWRSDLGTVRVDLQQHSYNSERTPYKGGM